MSQKDIKMICKDVGTKDEWYPNRIDFSLEGKVLETVDSTNRIVQAVKKAVLSPLYPWGYGTDISFLRGKKSVIREIIIKTRILRTLKIIEQMYNQTIEPISMDTKQIKDRFYINFEIMSKKFNINI